MKNKAFTLIEVLIVVLIIGILAAISVTQYNKSVLKSRFSGLMPIARSVYDGQEVFFLSHGKYANDFASLDVLAKADISGKQADINGVLLTMEDNSRHTYVKATKNNLENNYIMYQSKSKYFPGEIHCEAKTDNSLANWLCKVALKGKEVSGANAGRGLTEGYTDYVINGAENGYFPKNFENLTGKTAAGKFYSGDTCTGTEDYGCRALNVSEGSCYAQATHACVRSTYSNGSYCEGTADGGCSESVKFYNSSCLGTKNATCNGGEYYNSSCEGKGDLACASSTYDSSVCTGNSSSACGGSTFKKGSICYANVKGACGDIGNSNGTYNSTYEDTSCCIGQCPDYAPKCGCPIDSNTGQHALSC